MRSTSSISISVYHTINYTHLIMCGIAGYFLPDQQRPPAVAAAMCQSIFHRGPDEDGLRIAPVGDSGECAIGMRRLSIIDLSTGRQPISNEDETVWVVFNGEIYNFPDLQKELEGKGHRFRTRSDTEVLVHLYEEYGIEGLRRLRGMFAFALWDSSRRKLLLARDKLGKKPLYVARHDGGIYFGSEIKCFRAAGLPLDIDPEALRWYFLLSYVPDPLSCYRQIEKLLPGGWMTIDASGAISQGTYWTQPLHEETEEPCSYEAARDRLRELFDESVRIRLLSDVPLGAFLSGGIDSSLVVASMARIVGDGVKTFSIGFAEPQFDESPYAKIVADQYRTEHHSIQVEPASVDLISRLVQACDEPFADSSAIPTFIVSQFAAQHVKVVLSGDGGDEFLGGYGSFFEVRRSQWMDAVPRPGRALLRAVSRAVPYATYGKNYMAAVGSETPFARYLATNYTPRPLLERLLRPEWLLPGSATLDPPAPVRGAGALAQAIYFESANKLSGDILVKVDRMSMANSLEVRSPMLDAEFVSFCASLPHHWKMGADGKGKRILLDALGDRLPREILNRPKKGFSLPLPAWFRGSLQEFLYDQLLSRSFLDREIVSESFLRYLIGEMRTGRRDNSRWLWSLLILAVWFQEQRSQ